MIGKPINDKIKGKALYKISYYIAWHTAYRFSNYIWSITANPINIQTDIIVRDFLIPIRYSWFEFKTE